MQPHRAAQGDKHPGLWCMTAVAKVLTPVSVNGDVWPSQHMDYLLPAQQSTCLCLAGARFRDPLKDVIK